MSCSSLLDTTDGAWLPRAAALAAAGAADDTVPVAAARGAMQMEEAALRKLAEGQGQE